MLMLGVTSVGATGPGTVGNVNVVVTSAGVSAVASPNTSVTAANYRDAPIVTNVLNSPGGFDGGLYDACMFAVTGNPNTVSTLTNLKGDTGVTDITPYICGTTNPIFEPAAYPLWEVQTGTTINGHSASQILVVPPTQVNPSGTAPGKTYVIETFR
jgi:hypothetical protein